VSWAALAVLVGCTAGLAGCARSAASPSPAPPPARGPSSAGGPLQPPSVKLSPGQASTVRVAPVEMHRFAIERVELGNVAFAEDPAIVQAESTLLGAAATLRLDRKELERAQRLYDTQGVSAREVEQARSDEQTAHAALTAARSTLRALGKSDAQITRMITTGRIDPPRMTRGRSWVEANVFEADAPLFHRGQPVRVTVPAFPGQAFTGVVSGIYATVDPNLHRQTVRCRVGDPKSELRPGMLATVTIEVSAPVESPAIPADGVVREGDGTLTAWVTRDRRHYTQRVVETGLRENGEVQILKGLRPRELAVTQGAIFLDNMVNAAPGD
jgi:cobalt-zinc-cadmium efflux system membrane fusion protein